MLGWNAAIDALAESYQRQWLEDGVDAQFIRTDNPEPLADDDKEWLVSSLFWFRKLSAMEVSAAPGTRNYYCLRWLHHKIYGKDGRTRKVLPYGS